jgi:hypothetical protein
MTTTEPSVESVDWNGLMDHLIAEFESVRACAIKDIDRLRKVVDAIVACCPLSYPIKAEAFDVKQMVNDLKTVERYIKREVERIESQRLEQRL